jgi:hypothetical protein
LRLRFFSERETLGAHESHVRHADEAEQGAQMRLLGVKRCFTGMGGSQSYSVVGIHRGLARNRPDATAERAGADGFLVVGFFGRRIVQRLSGTRCLGRDGFVLGNFGLPTNSAIGPVVISLRDGLPLICHCLGG